MNEDEDGLHTQIRLDPEGYRQLCQQVLERDGWHCQYCGRLGARPSNSPKSVASYSAGKILTECVDSWRIPSPV
jgi:hypothetical protein